MATQRKAAASAPHAAGEVPAVPVRVYIEEGTKRVFACALDWPGWCRAGRTPDLALSTLGDYADRYAAAIASAGAGAPSLGHFEVVERLAGSATTDFGAPAAIASADTSPGDAAEGARLTALLQACWHYLDVVAASAPPQLRKGPRGGGRDRDAIVAHVDDAQAAYARKLGIRSKPPQPADVEGPASVRAALVDVLSRPHDGSPPVARGWPVRYAVRRLAWHVLDHAWEIQDRSEPSPRM